jgi:hypothetical protein
MQRFWKENSLSIVLFSLFLIILGGQIATGHREYNDQQREHGQPEAGLGAYLGSGHFIEATFENWESEFLQMGAYVLFTIWLRQKGAVDSKPLEGEAEVDKEPEAHEHAPWPVKRGGWILALYKNSLSIALFALFFISLGLHAYGGRREYNAAQLQHGGEALSLMQFVGSSRFWFESLQNWQSEFLSIGALGVLSIWLRQKGSSESKPVDAPYDEVGEK